jgi:hypothetical protein
MQVKGDASWEKNFAVPKSTATFASGGQKPF